jgi:hypothetical protein
MRILITLYILLQFYCSGIESEKSYCEKRADYYFTLCLLNINLAPGYYNKPEWNQARTQEFARNYCLLEYQRKKRCVDKSSSEPRRSDP